MSEYMERYDEQETDELDVEEQENAEEGPRMVGDWVVTNSIQIGGREIVLGHTDSPGHEETPYMVCKVQGLGDIPMEKYDDCFGGDYVSMLIEFANQLKAQAEKVQARNAERGITETYTKEQCLPGNMNTLDLEGKVVVVNPDSIVPESRTVDHQLMLAETGFGCKPGSRGRKVYGTNLYTGKSTLWYREDILGVVKPECLPDWAKKTLSNLEQKKAEKNNDKGER